MRMLLVMEGNRVGFDPQQDQQLGLHHHRRKRKADSPLESNERLSKRLSLLNLERNGPRLYVPVEQPSNSNDSTGSVPVSVPASPQSRKSPSDGCSMQLDDSKYKVYIYNLDDELSSEGEPDDAQLVVLPDLDEHLRSNRIPQGVLTKSSQESAGRELVLYRLPSSITVPEEQDGVRRAVLEARTRIRQRQEIEGSITSSAGSSAADDIRQPKDSTSSRDATPRGSDPDAMELD